MPTSSPAVLETVRWGEDQNVPLVPLNEKSKIVKDGGYSKANWVPPKLVYYTVNRCGVGAVLGPQRGGFIDVDIDALDIVDIIEAFFPATDAIFGRASKPRSHRLYRVEAPEFPWLKYQDPITKKFLFEIRGDGGLQTVLPGSVHETGEVVEWPGGIPPALVVSVSAEALTHAGMLSAVCALIRRYIWLEGMRDQGSLHMSGLLFKLGWSEHDVLTVFRVAAASDWDHKAEQRIKRTFSKFEKGEAVTGSKALRELLGKSQTPVIDIICNWAGSPDANAIEEYNERFAAVLIGGSFRIADLNVSPSFLPVFMAQDDFKKVRGTDYLNTLDAKGKPILKANRWLANSARRAYDDVDFMPGEPPDVVRGNQRILNMWTGWAVEAKAGNCAAWIELLWVVICGEDERLFHWMLHWFASIICEPMNKPLTSVAIIGIEGAGKTLLFHYFGKILGECYVPVTKEEHIHGRFNAHTGNALLIQSEEALSPTDRKHINIIKSKITDPFDILELKGINPRKVNSYARMSFTTNEPQAVAVGIGDRRFTIIDMGKRKIGDDLKQRVLTELNNDGPAALLYYFKEELDYDAQMPRTNIKNPALLKLKEMNYDVYTRWWLERLDLGIMLDKEIDTMCRPEGVRWPTIVSKRALQASCIVYARRNNIRNFKLDDTIFKEKMATLLGRELQHSRRWFNPYIGEDPTLPREFCHLGDRHPTFENIPELEVCQRAFEIAVGQKIEWLKTPDDEAHLDEEQ